MSDVVLYHAGCPDGFGAAWLLQRMLVPDAQLVPMDWHQPPPAEAWVTDGNLWSVDYCPDGNYLDELGGVLDIITVFDHHQSSVKEIGDRPHFTGIGAFLDASDLGALDHTSIVIDQSHSGIGLVARYAKHVTGEGIPWFVKYIEDRDLWRFDFFDTKNVSAAIASLPMTVEAWNSLAAADPQQVIAEGMAINRYREQLVEQCAASSVRVHLDEWDVQCSVSPYAIGSDVAGLLAERSPDGIGAYCILHPDRVQFGLRSRGDGPDVAQLAERFGGGGHEHASGFTVNYCRFGLMMDSVYL